jgi:hypothetical protein
MLGPVTLPSTNGGRPARVPSVRRPLRLLLGAAAALVVLGALVAPVVITRGSGSGGCQRTLGYRGRIYTARPMPSPALVESTAIGVGILRGCGADPSNIDVRTLRALPRAIALGIPGEAGSLYVRRGLCDALRGSSLLRCLKTSSLR